MKARRMGWVALTAAGMDEEWHIAVQQQQRQHHQQLQKVLTIYPSSRRAITIFPCAAAQQQQREHQTDRTRQTQQVGGDARLHHLENERNTHVTLLREDFLLIIGFTCMPPPFPAQPVRTAASAAAVVSYGGAFPCPASLCSVSPLSPFFFMHIVYCWNVC